jgi:hypothetical protein
VRRDRVAALPQPLGIKRHVPSLDNSGLHGLLKIACFLSAQLSQIGQLAIAHRILHGGQESLHLGLAVRHATAQHEIGVRREAEVACQLMARGGQREKRVDVGLAALRQKGAPHALAGGRHGRVFKHREHRGLRQTQPVAPVGVARCAAPHPRWHAGEFGL